MQIHKYILTSPGLNNIQMPEGAEILSAQMQDGGLVVWAKVDTDKPKVLRQIMTVFTGQEFGNGDNYKYISTVQSSGFVHHVFEVVYTP